MKLYDTTKRIYINSAIQRKKINKYQLKLDSSFSVVANF